MMRTSDPLPSKPEQTGPQTAVGRPLISFCLLAFNQARFIREAVASALAQTYSPLEIILSDDCSSDGTFLIMQELLATCRGPHRVVLNRNERNLGIGGHLNEIYHRIAHGVLLVNAAGDDVSEPNRVMALHEAYSASPAPPSLIFSNARCIDERGKESACILDVNLPAAHDRRTNGMVGGLPVVGCAAAIDRQLVASFPPMRNGIMAEDVVLTRRAYLRNGVAYVPKILVRYRVHSDGVSQLVAGNYRRGKYLPMQLRWVKDRALRFEQAREDIELVNPASAQEMLQSLTEQERLNDLRRCVLTEGGLSGLRAVLWEAGLTRRLPKETIRAYLIRWLDVYRFIDGIRGWLGRPRVRPAS